jgi:hypothetical protein
MARWLLGSGLDEMQTNTEYPLAVQRRDDGTPYTIRLLHRVGGLPGFAYRDVGIVVLREPVQTSDQ